MAPQGVRAALLSGKRASLGEALAWTPGSQRLKDAFGGHCCGPARHSSLAWNGGGAERTSGQERA